AAGGGRGLGLILALLVLGFVAYGSVYRVNTNEQGVVMRFGEYVRWTPPGLHFKLPYPIESVMTPEVTNVNQIDIGTRTTGRSGERSASASLSVPEESLMLTGDENIVDINFTVQWKINEAADYLFNVEDPERTVKAVAESVMREVVGQSAFQVLQTTGRLQAQLLVQTRMQEILDGYKSGIAITEVKLAKVDPPAQVIESFRDVQAARADQERFRNEAETYANQKVPEARGQAEQLIQGASAYREQTVAQAQGESLRFLSIYNEYKNAKDVTRERMYLETMERVLGDMSKVLMDQNGSGAVPYLPLNQLTPNAGTKPEGAR
ncbi:MAG: FtsH protease activity modulator HflK, partial [Parvibaculum sp.]